MTVGSKMSVKGAPFEIYLHAACIDQSQYALVLRTRYKINFCECDEVSINYASESTSLLQSVNKTNFVTFFNYGKQNERDDWWRLFILSVLFAFLLFSVVFAGFSLFGFWHWNYFSLFDVYQCDFYCIWRRRYSSKCENVYQFFRFFVCKCTFIFTVVNESFDYCYLFGCCLDTSIGNTGIF